MVILVVLWGCTVEEEEREDGGVVVEMLEATEETSARSTEEA